MPIEGSISDIAIGDSFQTIKLGEQYFHLASFWYRPTDQKDLSGNIAGVHQLYLEYIGAGPVATRLVFNHIDTSALNAVGNCMKQLALLGAVPVGEKFPIKKRVKA